MRLSRNTVTIAALVMSVQILGAQTRITPPKNKYSPQEDVQLGREAPEPRLRLEEAALQQPAPERRDRMQQPAAFPEPSLEVLLQILAADRLACLARGPGRVRAPVRALARALGEGRGQP